MFILISSFKNQIWNSSSARHKSSIRETNHYTMCIRGTWVLVNAPCPGNRTGKQNPGAASSSAFVPATQVTLTPPTRAENHCIRGTYSYKRRCALYIL